MRNIFLEKFYRKYGGGTVIKNGAYLGTNNLNFYTVCFYYMSGSGLSKYMETNFHLLLCHINLRLKRGLKLVSLPHFLMIF